jgi:hypothetical protein
MWEIQPEGTRVFRHGQEAFALAADAASNCNAFKPDVEEEWVVDEERSCYNCRLRRWTAGSFACLLTG